MAHYLINIRSEKKVEEGRRTSPIYGEYKTKEECDKIAGNYPGKFRYSTIEPRTGGQKAAPKLDASAKKIIKDAEGK